MRAQDKRNVLAGINMGASPQQVAAELNVPVEEVRAIYRKHNRPNPRGFGSTG